MLALIVTLATLGACWRDAPPPAQPQRSFVARVSALTELRRGTDAVARRTEATMQRIVGLASEAEREALLADVVALEEEVMRLAGVLERAREDREDPAMLAELAEKLQDAMFGVTQLRAELRHARTTAELEAFEALKRKLEGTHDAGPFTGGRQRNVPGEQRIPPVPLLRDPNAPPLWRPGREIER